MFRNQRMNTFECLNLLFKLKLTHILKENYEMRKKLLFESRRCDLVKILSNLQVQLSQHARNDAIILLGVKPCTLLWTQNPSPARELPYTVLLFNISRNIF